jgi:biopolymer transport protein ExbB
MLRNILFRVLALAAVLVIVAALIFGAAGISANQPTQTQQTLFQQFVVAAGPIVWFILLPMSLLMVYLAVENFITLSRRRLLSQDVSNRIVEQVRHSGPSNLQTEFADTDDLVAGAVVRAVTGARGDWFRMRNLLFESLEERAVRLLRKIEWLNLIGSVSPMVGLFGTVFGMIKLFDAIVTTGGQPRPAHLAEGMSIALVTTFWGLLIAIPAVTLHGIFRNRIEQLLSDATLRAEDILSQLAPRPKPQVATRQPPQKKRLKFQQIRELSSKSDRETDPSLPTP